MNNYIKLTILACVAGKYKQKSERRVLTKRKGFFDLGCVALKKKIHEIRYVYVLSQRTYGYNVH